MRPPPTQLLHCTPKGWVLDRVYDSRDVGDYAHCNYCGARIRWVFELRHDEAPSNQPFRVGSECVHSFIKDVHAQEALSFLRSKWRQRRGYFWKRFRDQAAIVGAKSGSWWAATADSLLTSTWNFCPRRFNTAAEAKAYITRLVICGTPTLAPRPTTFEIDAFVSRFRRIQASRKTVQEGR